MTADITRDDIVTALTKVAADDYRRPLLEQMLADFDAGTLTNDYVRAA